MRATTALLTSGLVIAASLAPSRARADSLRGTRSDDLTERAQVAVLRLDRGHATLVVQRTIANTGPTYDQAVYSLDLPSGAVATGLRTLGMVGGEHHWWSAELMDAAEAEDKYRELTGFGLARPKDPSLLYWRGWGQLGLQVFPVAPGGVKTIEYTLVMPTEYRGGLEVVTLKGDAEHPSEVTPVAVHPEDRVLVDGAPWEPERVTLRDTDHQFSLERRSGDRLGGPLAVVAFGDRRVLSHFRVEAAARLSEVPHGAHVVVLIDTSRSRTQEQVDASVAAARAYLGHFDDGRAEVVLFDRQPRPMHGALVPVAEALHDLSTAVIERHNGSQVDDALERAGALLDAAGSPGSARRVVVLSDLRMRQALTAARIAATLARPHAVVHVGRIEDGKASLVRDDDAPWTKPVRATGGLVWAATASPSDELGLLADVYEEWARPLRVDRFKVIAPNLGDLYPPEVLSEGEGFEDLRISAAPAPYVDVVGELWATPVHAVLRPSEAEAKLWAGLVFGSDASSSLNEDDMKVLARRGQVVSPVTSYLAIEPGVRPSTEGLDEGELLGSGSGGGGSGSGIGIGSIGTLGHSAFDPLAYLRVKLAERCPAVKGATVELETTLEEVVDVPSVKLKGASDPAAEGCLREAAWGLELPGNFREDEASYTVEL